MMGISSHREYQKALPGRSSLIHDNPFPAQLLVKESKVLCPKSDVCPKT